MDPACSEGGLAGAKDRLRRGEVWFPDFHVDDVAAFGLQGLGPGHQFHHVERGDIAVAAGGAVKSGHGRGSQDKKNGHPRVAV